MDRIENVLDSMYRFCGLRVYAADATDDPPDGLLCDRSRGRTYFTVKNGGKEYALYIDGADERDGITAALAREYITSALAKSVVSENPVRDFLNGGELPTSVRIGKTDFYVFAVYGATHSGRIYEYLSAMAARDDFVADMGDGVTAFCKKSDDDSDYQSAGEFAFVLHENLAEEIEGRIKIGVGGVAHGVSELPLYFSYARMALLSGAEFDPNNDIYSYKEYALIRILSELSPTEKEKYIKTVLDKNYREVLSDIELMSAAEAFIKHSLNVSEASRSMYVHRNTLIYRLDKIEKITGLNIRNFSDAMSFRVAYLMSKSLSD